MAEVVRPAFPAAALLVTLRRFGRDGMRRVGSARSNRLTGFRWALDDQTENPAAAAAAAPTERIPEATELVGVWVLEDLGGRGVMDVAQTTMGFDGEGRVSGSGGCNRYTGSYTYADGELAFGPLAGTKMMCPEAVMDQEDRFHRALGAIERVAVNDPFLLIYCEGSENRSSSP